MTKVLKLGVWGVEVAVVQERLVALGFDVPRGEVRDDQFGPGTGEAIERFQREAGLPVTSVVDPATSRALGLGEPPTSITGLVSRPDGTPLAGLSVELVRPGPGDGGIVGATQSAADGSFSLPWPERVRGPLAVRVEGGPSRIIATPTDTGAAWVRLTVGGEYKGRSRFAVLMATIAPVLEGVELHTLGREGRASELVAIRDATALRGSDISRLVLAHKLGAEAAVEPAVFFGLFSRRVPASLDAALQAAEPIAADEAQLNYALAQVLALRDENVRSALVAAIAENAIPEIDLELATRRLHELRLAHLGSRPFRLGKTPFRDLLATVVTAPIAEQVIEAYATHGTTAAFWNQLAQADGVTPEILASLRFTLKTAVLLRNHLPLLRHAQQQRAAGAITSPSALARLDRADWGALLRDVDPAAAHLTFTANLKFETLDERIDHFAQQLATRFERRFPTAAFAGRLARHGAELKLSAPTQLAAFLDANPELSLRRTHLDAYLKQQGAHALAAEVVVDLKKVQRVYKLTRQFDQARAMLIAGHTSALSVYSTGRTRFVATMAATGVTPRAARAIFARAEATHATTLALLGNFNSAMTSVAPAAVAQPIAASDLTPLLAGFPDLQSLFGSTDYCSCEHCRAIHGPAAYLVDILQFLQQRYGAVHSARDVLFARRADLGEIELSCDNTTGVVPYIDLACEILEDAVAAPAPGATRARQTTGTLAERRANPQFVNEAAYATLRDAVYPQSSPFDLWTVEVRAFLRQLGVAWHELLSAFQVPGTNGGRPLPTDAQIAGEQLGFDRRSLAIVIAAAPPNPWVYWGLAEAANSIPDPRTPDDPAAVITGTWLEVLAFVPIVLHRTGLRHRELVQLLGTRFVNPDGAIEILETSTDGFAHCDTGTQTITNLTPDALSRFARFLRLWRRVGCTIWDLDKVLGDQRVGRGSLGPTAIADVARVDRLAVRLGLAWDELLGLWSTIDRLDYLDVLHDSDQLRPSVYRRRFRNPSVMQASTVFVEDPTQLTGLLGSPEALAGISAALNLSGDDIARIRAATDLSAPNTRLNLPNLSAVFRYAVLARGLRLTSEQLLVALAVTGVDPFFSPASTLELLGALEQVRDSGFTLQELHYLLRHGSALESGIALADSTIAGWLEDLRKGLVRIGRAREQLVTQRISDLLPLDPTLTRLLLRVTLPGASVSIGELFTDPRLTQRAVDGSFAIPSDRVSFGDIFDAFVVLAKLRTVLARWRVSTRDASWLLTHAGEVGWLALHTLPASAGNELGLAPFVALRRNVAMQQALVATNETRLFDVVLGRDAPLDIVAAGLAALGNWDPADVLAIAARFEWTTGAALVAADSAPQIRDLMPWARKLGTDMATTLGFVTTDVGPAKAQQARQLAKARYDLDKWYAIAGTIQDDLREQKRAALVAWLLVNPDSARAQRWVNVEELYGYHLIDPEMSPVAETTRIKQAAASVQLFVQRCFLQREPEVIVGPADPGWAQWEWMKRFRLWEANRKIFLYPENWIDPSRRRAKSAFFSELEAELQQAEVTHAAAEDALLNYVHKLADVSNLEICGLCDQFDYGRQLLHVVARTRKSPHIHYYRRLGSTGVWSPWERLDLEIDSSHVLPVYWGRRLFVFWPEFRPKSYPRAEDRSIPKEGGGSAAEPRRYWEVMLAWSERRRDHWLPKRQSKLPQLAGASSERYFTLKGRKIGHRLNIDMYRSKAHEAQWQLSSGENEPVMLAGGLGDLGDLEAADEIGSLRQGPRLQTSATTDWYFNSLSSLEEGLKAGTEVTLSLLEGYPQQDLGVLGKISQPRLMVQHQDVQFTSQGPFFLSDPRRTFFVRPSFVSTAPYSRPPSGSTTFTTEYSPEIFYHPYAETFLRELAYGGVDGLYARRLQLEPDVIRGSPPLDFVLEYEPTTAVRRRPAPEPPYPVETIDYSHGGSYSAYNWELFFHAPLLIAQRLADNQRFDEALRWFHYIFNPSATTGGTVPQRYWIPRVFHDLTAEDYARQQIERLLQLVNQGDPELAQKVAEWRADPFDPHLIASSRPVAYQKALVMHYISTLIAWGDQLFRGDTIETINEATQLYLLASQLLGPRPQNLRAVAPRQAKTYAELAPSLDVFGNAAVEIENVISIPPPGTGTSETPLPQLHTFYFCIPPNDKLLGYWDTVADRLFKIRHGMNLDGVVRSLALYEPPIDPELLVRAAAAGIELSSAVADLEVAQPCYRFLPLWGAAQDLCNDVRGLGASILGALERRDAEALSRLQSTQEIALLEAMRVVKQDQLAEARTHRTALVTSRDMAVLRRDYYESREFLSPIESTGLSLAKTGLVMEVLSTVLDRLAGAAQSMGSQTIGGAGFGGTPVAWITHGGEAVGNAVASAASAQRSLASWLHQGANLANTIAGYERRRDDWDLQERVADKEIVQIDRQLIAADIRIALCEHELDAHDRQIENANNVAEVLASRFTNRELYDWIISQLSTTYFQAYQLAYDLAKRASKAYAFELGADPGYIQFGYWDSLHKGLHAGDKLLLDLRRLHAEYLDKNRRQLELVKHVSLLQLDPMALVRLKQTGQCFINLPESVFDLDQPGHYLRRLKTVSVTLPCVTGPYTSVNATLTLVSHAVRHASEPGTAYLPAVDADGIPLESDPRFSRSSGAVESVALSTGREDPGLFEVNFHDDRYLPFEGLGAIGHWRLELPLDTNRFDMTTLSDVILHLKYTARDGGQLLRDAARAAVIDALPRSGLQLLSARTEFPDAWARLWAAAGDGQQLDLALNEKHLPFVPSNRRHVIAGIAAVLLFHDEQMYADYQAVTPLKAHLGFATPDGSPPAASSLFTPEPGLGYVPIAPVTIAGSVGPLALAFLEPDLAAVPLLSNEQAAPDGTLHHRLDRDLIDDVLILVSYQIEDRR